MYWTACLLAVAYATFVDGYQAWVWPTKDVFEGLVEFVKVAMIGFLMVGAEWYGLTLVFTLVYSARANYMQVGF